MKMGIGGWIGLIGGLIGGFIGMAAAVIASPIFGGLFSLVFIAIFGGVFWAFIRPIFRQNALLKTGEPATAKVLQIWDTGVTLNQNPQIGLLLEVSPKGKPSYQVKTKTYVSRLQTSAYQPGMMLAVRYDPNDPTQVAIEGVGAASGGGGQALGAAQATEMLQKIDAENRAIAASGESAEATVVKYTEMGINVNGNNPAVELLLQVKPDAKPHFTAVAKGIVAEASVPKYQPGKMVYVKFDPNDFTRVAIDHSA